MDAVAAAARLRDATRGLRFGGRVAFAYHPLDYAWDVHRAFAARFGAGPKRLLFVGMNPGPWGMTQTGVPFGSARRVTAWMMLSGAVRTPEAAHPKRPVLGLACPRDDPSGERFYAWAESRWGTAAAFFRECYVVNHCPIFFADAEGRNLAPGDVPRRDLDPALRAGDEHLAALLDALRPQRVVAVGKWAEAQARRVAEPRGLDVLGVLHPSPASPRTNVGWSRIMDEALPP